MKRIFRSLTVLLVFSVLSIPADESESLSGNWVAEKSDGQGRAYKQVLEIKKSKFIFKILGGDQTVLYAEGDVKTEQLGPFKAAKFFNIKAGKSASSLEPSDDDHTLIYVLGDDEMTVGVNFDKERGEPANVTKYIRVKASAGEPKTLVIDKIVMHKTPQGAEWYLCFDAAVGDTSKRFHVAEKAYANNTETIATELAIPGVRPDQVCKFVMKLDDVSGDECSDEMDDKSTGEFNVTESGSQTYKPEEHWHYTIYWHLK